MRRIRAILRWAAYSLGAYVSSFRILRFRRVTARYGPLALLTLALLVVAGHTAQAERQAFALADALHLEKAGQATKARTLLDTLVSREPQNLTYRLALARNLLRAGERARAQHHLSQLRGHPDLSPSERRELRRILARIEGGTAREGWLRLALIPESNPGQRTEAETIEIDGLHWQLRDSARARAATGLLLGAGGAMTPHLGEGLRLRLGASFEARLYEDEGNNDIFLRAEAGLEGRTAGDHSWKIALTAVQRHVAGRRYGEALGVTLGWGQALGARNHLRLTAHAEDWRHPKARMLDGPRLSASASLTHALRPDLALRAALHLHRTKAAAPWEAHRALGLSLGVSRLFAGGLMMGLDYTHHRLRKDAAAPLLGVMRRDRRHSVTARLLHREVTVKGFAPALDIGFDRQKSNSDLNDFRNVRASVAFTREF